jgi:hypothetical protein
MSKYWRSKLHSGLWAEATLKSALKNTPSSLKAPIFATTKKRCF